MGYIERIAVDDDTMRRLTEEAQRNGRSLAEQAAMVLRGEVRRMSREEFIRRADEIAAMTPKGIAQTDSALLLREDRDR
jgi:hypothetical protein